MFLLHALNWLQYSFRFICVLSESLRDLIVLPLLLLNLLMNGRFNPLYRLSSKSLDSSLFLRGDTVSTFSYFLHFCTRSCTSGISSLTEVFYFILFFNVSPILSVETFVVSYEIRLWRIELFCPYGLIGVLVQTLNSQFTVL